MPAFEQSAPVHHVDDMTSSGDVVISGISGRLPESENLEEFRQNLMNGVDMVTDDGRRWEPGMFGIPARCGKLKDLTKFDAGYFGVHPKQADTMDPQIRMLLEVTYEAMVDAGVDPATLRGSNTGVFIGASDSEARQGWSADPETTSGYILTGGTVSMFANRVSYAFDLQGPSYVVDTACSSSLLALDHALNAIRAGKCDSAIVGGTSICIRPNTALAFNRMSMLAPDGTCKSFDASGDGYSRSEAVVAILLQRSDLAKRHYAELVQTGTNSDGFKSQGITYPSGEQQKKLLLSVYENANLDPREVCYVEAHGTGTKVGDPQEVNAIADVFCKGRQTPLLIGSVKSNMGHPEPASGLAALSKVVIALQDGLIPANLHYNTPNPDIAALTDGRLTVVTRTTPLVGDYVAINSFGFGGSNVHAILKRPTKAPTRTVSDPSTRLVLAAGRTPEAVERVLETARSHAHDPHYHNILQQSACQSASGQPHRGFSLVNNDVTATEGGVVSGVEACPVGERRPVWFVFSGMGTQWQGMARKLMSLDTFKKSIMRSDRLLKKYDVQLYDLLMTGSEKVWEDILNSFVAVAAIQVALVDVLRDVGVTPDGIVGHSVGELGCGYADGTLTAEETVLAAYWRGRCVQEAKLPPGAMAAVGLTWEETKRRCPPGVVPACHNAIDTVTISGPAEEVREFVAELKSEGVFAKEVSSAGTAFHSYYMRDIAPALNAALRKVILEKKPRSSSWISSSIPESEWHTDLAKYSSADYYTNNLVSPVLFQEALHHIPHNAVTIEIGPHCLLQAILKRSLAQDCTLTSLMKRGHHNNLEYLLANLGKLHMAGINVNPLVLSSPLTYPVPLATPMLAPHVNWDHSQTWDVPKAEVFYKGPQGASVYEIDCNNDEFLKGHRIDGRVLYPATGYLVLAWKTLAKQNGRIYTEMPVVFEDVVIHRATILPSVGKVMLEVNVMAGSGDFEVLENGSVTASGNVRILEDSVHKFPAPTPSKSQNGVDHATNGIENGVGHVNGTDHVTNGVDHVALSREDVYKELRLRGYDYGPTFQCIHGADSKGEVGEILWQEEWISFLDALLQMCVLSRSGRSLRLPTRIKSVRVDPALHRSYICENWGKQVIPCTVDNHLGTITAGAVEMLGLHATVAPRRKQQEPTLESFSFVQNRETREPTELQKRYLADCLLCIDRNYEKFKTHPNLETMRLLRADFHESGIKYDHDDPRFFLLAHLDRIYNELPHESETILREDATKLHRDLLLSTLMESRVLKPCLDIVIENSTKSKLKVAEINEFDHVCQSVTSLVTSHPQVTLDYSFLTSTPSHHDEEALTEMNVSLTRWHLTETYEQQDLVIVRRFLSLQEDIDENLSKLESLVKDGGFLLVEEITANHLLGYALYGLATESVIGPQFFTEQQWEEKFRKYGFEVAAQKSDGLLSTLFLLKKIPEDDSECRILCVDEAEFAWVDSLKEMVQTTTSANQRLWLVSCDPESGILGLVTCLRKEPGGERIRCAFICEDCPKPPDWSAKGHVMRDVIKRDLVMNVRQNGIWGTYRHLSAASDLTSSSIQTQHAYVNVLTRGDLSSLRWVESPLKYFSPQRQTDQDLCSVYYTSLNFRDVMLAAGKLPPDAIPGHLAMQDCILGLEFSGRDSGGRRVMGLLPAKGLATCVDAKRSFLWEVPEHWSLEEAATVPVVYSTVYYALVLRGRIRKGDRVLIHSGSGGVGQAAIAVALHYGCDVFTTVGTKEKREYIKHKFPELKDDHISNSRDTSFEYDVLKVTLGRGVDLVLNSLAEDKLQASLRVLAQHGRFLEIGKVDLSRNTNLGMSLFLKNVTFHGILLDALFEEECCDWQEVYDLVQKGIIEGAVRPLRSTMFDRDELEDAFRYMAHGKHIGKVLIQIREEEPGHCTCPATPLSLPALPRTACHPDKVYIITGGLGGFGLELADWLIERGAAKLVLTSRSGIKTGYQSQRVTTWRANDIHVVVSMAAMTTHQECSNFIGGMMKLGPIGGVFNLAMVLKDAMLEDQSVSSFDIVHQSKVSTTCLLDRITRERCPTLDYFVAFSSIVAGRGNIGQTNYGLANSVLERVCERRVQDGLPGLAVQWGAIGDVGVVLSALKGDNDTEIAGTLPQRIYSCLATLDRFLNQQCPVMSSFVAAEKRRSEQAGASSVGLVSAVANVLGLKDVNSVSAESTLADFGLDSLMGVEIKQTLERDFDMNLSSQEIRLLTFAKLQEISQDGGLFKAKEEKEPDPALAQMDDSGVFLRYEPDQLMPVKNIVKLNEGVGVPIFIVHPIEGTTLCLGDLANLVRCPVYGLQCTAQSPLDTIENLASSYVQAVKSVQTEGPYRIGGYSFGAMVAFEMTLQLQSAKDKVDQLLLLDGSHSFVSAYTSQQRLRLNGKESEMECMILCGFMSIFLSMDHKKLFDQLLAQSDFPARLDYVAQIMGPKFAYDDVISAAQSFHDKLTAGIVYQPGDQWQGEATLIRARDRLEPTKVLGEDYGLEKVCEGSVYIHTVDGDHESFIRNPKTAEIVNHLLHA